jgi:hypothetical protein
MMWGQHFTSSEFDDLVIQIDDWNKLLSDIRQELLTFSRGMIGKTHKDDPKHLASEKLAMLLFYRFSSIAILAIQGHCADAFCLLRSLYEGSLHLWNICTGNAEQALRFLFLANIQDWRIAKEALEIDGAELDKKYYTRDRMKDIKEQYEVALEYFNSRPGKIPRCYTSDSPKVISNRLRDSEAKDSPLRKLIHLRLYSAASEHVHTSSFAMMDGYALVERKEIPEGTAIVLPNPERCIESAWFASLIIIDCIRWYASLLNLDVPNGLQEAKKKAVDLARKWLRRQKS